MGMFDSFYDNNRIEYQTKALDCNLDVYRIGDAVPRAPFIAHQMMVLGGPPNDPYRDTFATLRDGHLEAVPAERDARLPLLDYCGGWLDAPEGK